MKRLLEIQHKLKAPKGQFNNFGKYKYRSAEDILEAVKPLLHEQGLLLTLTDEAFMLGDRYYIRATATITDGAGFLVTNNAMARESESKSGMDASQITGTASSYARKYALNGLFLIDDTKDADTDAYQLQTKQQPAAAENKAPSYNPTGTSYQGDAETLKACKTLKALQQAWAALTPQAKNALVPVKNAMKATLENHTH